MDTKFTPGPWEKSFDRSKNEGRGGFDINTSEKIGGNGVYELNCAKTHIKNNADIIVAAPEMLKLLADIINAQYNKNGTLANLNSTIWNARDYLIKQFPEIKETQS